MSQYKRLGDLLAGQGVITEDQLRGALAYQAKEKVRLGEALIDLGFCQESDIVACLARQYDLPVVKAADQRPSKSALAIMPPSVALRKLILPVKLTNLEFHCIISDPLDFDVTDELAKALGRRVVMSLCGEKEICEAITKAYDFNVGNTKAELPAAPAMPLKRGKAKVQADRKDLLARLTSAATNPTVFTLTEGRA